MRSNTTLGDEYVCASCTCSCDIGNPLFLFSQHSLLQADAALLAARRATSSSGVSWMPKVRAVSVISIGESYVSKAANNWATISGKPGTGSPGATPLIGI